MALLKINSIIDNKFKIVEFLGESPWGEDYKTEKLDDRRLAILTIPTKFKKYSSILEQTALALKGVVHKNLTEIFEVGYIDPTKTLIYWAREWVNGIDFDTLIQKRFPLGAQLGFVKRFVYHLKNFLLDIHASFYHGRLTPKFIWLTDVGRIKISDPGFFTALRTKVPSISILTNGESLYIAPELRGKGNGSPKSDVYSFAALVHLLLSGKPPTEEGKIQLKPNVPKPIVEVLKQGLSQDPQLRPEIKEFGDQLYSLLKNIPEKANVSNMMVDLLHSYETSNTSQKYMVQKNRLDYGPYDANQIREQVIEDSIVGNDLVVSLDTGERYKLKEHPDFSEFYLEFQRKKEEERRKAADAQVKQEEKKQSRILKLSLILGITIILTSVASFLVYKAVGGSSKAKRKSLELADTDIDIQEDEEGVGKKITRRHKRRKRKKRSHSSRSAGKKINSYALDGVELSRYEIKAIINSSGVINKIARNCSLPPKGRIVISYQIAGRSGRVAYVSARIDGKINKKLARCAYRYLRKIKFPKKDTDLSGQGRIVY